MSGDTQAVPQPENNTNGAVSHQNEIHFDKVTMASFVFSAVGGAATGYKFIHPDLPNSIAEALVSVVGAITFTKMDITTEEEKRELENNHDKAIKRHEKTKKSVSDAKKVADEQLYYAFKKSEEKYEQTLQTIFALENRAKARKNSEQQLSEQQLQEEKQLEAFSEDMRDLENFQNEIDALPDTNKEETPPLDGTLEKNGTNKAKNQNWRQRASTFIASSGAAIADKVSDAFATIKSKTTGPFGRKNSVAPSTTPSESTSPRTNEPSNSTLSEAPSLTSVVVTPSQPITQYKSDSLIASGSPTTALADTLTPDTASKDDSRSEEMKFSPTTSQIISATRAPLVPPLSSPRARSGSTTSIPGTPDAAKKREVRTILTVKTGDTPQGSYNGTLHTPNPGKKQTELTTPRGSKPPVRQGK